MDVIYCCADLIGCHGAASSGYIVNTIRRRDRGAESEHRQRQSEDHRHPAASPWGGGVGRVGRVGGEQTCVNAGGVAGGGVFHGDFGSFVSYSGRVLDRDVMEGFRSVGLTDEVRG